MENFCTRPMGRPTTSRWSTSKPTWKLPGSKRARAPGESRSCTAHLERGRSALFADDEYFLRRDASSEAVLVGPRPQDHGFGQLDRLFVARIRRSRHAPIQGVAY